MSEFICLVKLMELLKSQLYEVESSNYITLLLESPQNYTDV